ncbi:MAG: class I SAM-dependent DNA methyltransferase [Deltaproteobacteria bacterium]|nr:class I SAM-dependent DNA methyltransferase [Myxococcales bacterium]MDP3220217.1 class I SAM-dependent DNA methyltransferase [Deltaproteobacteria bacterium]
MPPRRKSIDPIPPASLEVTAPREVVAAPRRFQSFSELSAFIFRVADLLRGPYQPSEYRHVFIPMTVLRRLDCVLAPRRAEVQALYKQHYADVRRQQNAEAKAEEATLDELTGLSFINVSGLDLASTRTGNLLDNLKAYLRGFSSNVRRLFDQFKLVTHLERIAAADPSGDLLDRVVATFVGVDLSPEVVDNHMMGTAFEDLNRRFLEQANEKAGEQYTPRDVIALIVDLCLAGSGDRFAKGAVRPKIYDPACGTGGMLTVADNRLREHNPKARPILFGQEWSEETWAICQADMLVRGERPDHVAQGNTFTEDRHPDERFDWQLSNPPFGVDWKGYEKAVRREHEDAQWDGRFGAGLPGVSDGSLLFVQHMVSKMRLPSKDGGRIAVVLNGSPLFTGKAGSGESEIRKWLVTEDLLEAIVALPEQLFFGTGIPTYLWLLTNKKPVARKGKVQLIDATGLGDRMKRALGGKRNEIGDRARDAIVALYRDFAEGPQSRIVAADELGYREVIVEYPLRMRFAATPERVATVGTEASLGERRARTLAKGAGMDAKLAALRKALATIDPARVFASWEEFAPALEKAVREADMRLSSELREAVIQALGERDPAAPPVLDEDGEVVADPELRDTEHVPLTEEIEAYLEREVRPFEREVWYDPKKVRVGYEIPVTRYFHTYEAPRAPEVVLEELRGVDRELRALMDRVLR